MDGGTGFGRQSVLSLAEAGASPAEAKAVFTPAAEKYALEGTLGRGGMGEVLLVKDRDLRRRVALKVMRPEMTGREAALHFVAEAQATSQLEHPGIPPVHDLGIAPDGRLYFTMKLVKGRTLRDVLHDLLLRRREVTAEYSLHRLVGVLERIAETLHYAHESGVVHRDVKPENVMLGDYGEVHVMDWGVARVRGSALEDDSAVSVRTARQERGLETEAGMVKGTLTYMSPEQVRGEAAVDRRSDVYALGLLLYEILTLHPAYDAADPGLVRKVALAEHPPLEAGSTGRRIPEALAATCRTALAHAAAERHATAQAFGGELRAWLDGTSERERRHREAEALAVRGIEAVAAYERAKAEALAAEAEVRARAIDARSWQPVREKGAWLEARRRAAAAKTAVALSFAEAVRLLEGALLQESENATARRALAGLWKGRLLEADHTGDTDEGAYAQMLLARYDDGALAAFMKGDGTLTLRSEPAGAEVLLYRYVERDGVLVAEEERRLGTTPVGPVPLAMGSYLCVLRRAGFRDVRYPVHVTRHRDWLGTVRLRTEEELGADFVLVPGGPFVFGEGHEQGVRTIPEFAIARSPVTFAQWAEFLAAVEREQGREAAQRLVPVVHGDGEYMRREPGGRWVPLPIICEGPAGERAFREHGPDLLDRIAVGGVSWHDADAYCRWKSRVTGRDCRLPTEEEREKAARGVDGRKFPWGDLADASLAKGRESRELEAQPEPVGTFPTATSVYGMLDAVGSSWDWTGSWYDERKLSRVFRGGGWASSIPFQRASFRHRIEPQARIGDLGLRLACSLAP